MRETTKLKKILARREAVIVPGVANAMFARIVEAQGFEAVYVTGAGIANMHLGAPDVGLTTVTEVAEITATIRDATTVPLIVDMDTGFGNAVNVVRTVRLLERAGASGLQLEDQVFPKKCGHFSGKEVIPADEMVQKIRAAVDARVDGDLQIIARTDARAIEGLDAALDRASAYIEAGADATFVEAPTDLDELAAIPARLDVPQFANMVHGGRTPDPGQKRLAEMGFSVALYANAVLQATIRAANDTLAELKSEGSLATLGDRLAGFEERQATVDKDAWDALEERYRKRGE
ncbi:oxaloacetate decarboxylase [Tropicimonas sp. IMCC34011]|uniref:isocitrate lyase/PEP mutase family protein n=1 Tax=Tropicimonas sp. IMCC34011 TaxID=2248759 RepID=UPI000E27BA39|nr:isocitrate lyase/PEP mutase family protein [Tropicimonas sp. IMCC34011]